MSRQRTLSTYALVALALIALFAAFIAVSGDGALVGAPGGEAMDGDR